MNKELEGLKVILASPTYGPVDPQCARDLRLGIMVAAQNGVVWVGDASADREGYSTARNRTVQSIVEAGPEFSDGILWVDSDIRQQPSDIAKLLTAVVRYKNSFVTGVYHQREPIHTPVFYHFNKEKQRFQPYEDYPEGVYMPVGGCGFGFVWTSYGLLDDIQKTKEFNQNDGWFADKRDAGGFGEDLNFCYLAIKADHQLFVHTGIQLGHVANPSVIYREDFLRERAKYIEAVEKMPDFKVQKRKWGTK